MLVNSSFLRTNWIHFNASNLKSNDLEPHVSMCVFYFFCVHIVWNWYVTGVDCSYICSNHIFIFFNRRKWLPAIFMWLLPFLFGLFFGIHIKFGWKTWNVTHCETASKMRSKCYCCRCCCCGCAWLTDC